MAQLLRFGFWCGVAVVAAPVAIGLGILHAATGCDPIEVAKRER
jgi:hypothetical protein